MLQACSVSIMDSKKYWFIKFSKIKSFNFFHIQIFFIFLNNEFPHFRVFSDLPSLYDCKYICKPIITASVSIFQNILDIFGRLRLKNFTRVKVNFLHTRIKCTLDSSFPPKKTGERSIARGQ